MEYSNYVSRKSTKETDDSTFDQTSRLVAWRTRINRLSKRAGSSITSKEFKMGKWYWTMEYYREKDTGYPTSSKGQDIVYLSLMTKEKQSFPPPIASFVVHVFCSKRSLRTTTYEAYKDSKIPYGDSQWHFSLDISTLDATIPVTFGLEFLDLKFENAKDGKTYSIWNDEYPKNTSNKPLGLKLLESTDKDILINARDGSINAHRHVLKVNSPVFEIMLSGNYIESKTSIVNMDDMSIGACKAMLNFLYDKKKSRELRAYNVELLVAADKYDIVTLKKACEVSLCEIVGARCVFKMLKYAHKNNLLELKNTCLFYLVKMGVIFELREDHNTFQREAVLEEDRELVVLLCNACLYG